MIAGIKNESSEIGSLQNIEPLITKYKYSNYNILKPYLIRLEHNIALDKKLDINDLTKIINTYTVDNFTFYENWKKRVISSLRYYVVLNDKIEELLEQLNYSTNWYYLFKWKLENWSYEYRLGYDVKF